MSDKRGAFRKYEVKRCDGTDATGAKHDGCVYFVLDLDHDEHARAAMDAYAESCKVSHPKLSSDILDALARSSNRCGCREAMCPHGTPPSFGEAFAETWR